MCVRVCVCDMDVDGLAPPIEKWQKAVNDQLEKIKKLEEIYEHELIVKKVRRGTHRHTLTVATKRVNNPLYACQWLEGAN